MHALDLSCRWPASWLLLIFGLLLQSVGAQEQPFAPEWNGSRTFVSPDTWAHPLYGWRVHQGRAVAHAAPKHRLHSLTHQIEHPEQAFRSQVTVEFLDTVEQPRQLTAGFSIGMQGLLDDYRHRISGTQREILAGIDATGQLFFGGRKSTKSLQLDGPVRLMLNIDQGQATLVGQQGDQRISVTADVEAAALKGNFALHAEAAKPFSNGTESPRVAFMDWEATGGSLEYHADQTFGPILWSQYTLADSRVKLNVQFAPIGQQDAQQATLKIGDRRWEAPIDPLSRTAMFRIDQIDSKVDHPYVVHYRWQNQDYQWKGTIRAEPEGGLSVAAFSCDHGYAFPLSKLVAAVAESDPDFLYFAGDQIYENYGGLRLQREPLEVATLDYLRKYYQFGWSWRDLLKDRPSVILPDDHDVFQGNLFGHGGRPLPGGDNNWNAGGFRMPAEWVNMVQRTQTGHLPDPVDPAPVEQGIGVYFTNFKYGGIPIMVLEDRKFKTGPDSVLPQRRQGLTADQLDVEGAQLLGERQEDALAKWSRQTADDKFRMVLTQTIFCKANTHSGPQLKPSPWGVDTNGWPPTPRTRALRFLQGHPGTVMVHGDQHFGILLRQGVEGFDDGPWGFMVPGTANGYPRAWWPDGDRDTGPFTDLFGNRFTVLAAANPEKGSNQLNARKSDDPEWTAFRKGSGYGIIRFKQPDQITFEMWRYPVETKQQFKGFPQTVTAN